jgi:hypothetical protein
MSFLETEESMGINKISGSSGGYETNTADIKKGQSEYRADDKIATNDTAAVYSRDRALDDSKKVYKRDNETIKRLLEESEERARSLRELVEKMLLKQGKTYDEATDIYGLLREGKLEVDPETAAQAQRDIAEDGYWGVEQTSERLLSFAKALTGGDATKADEMINAIKKGFEAAAKAWGGELPDICKRTVDAAIKKLEDWRDSLEAGDDMSDYAGDTF